MAEQCSQVPEFGNWEGKEDVPYTAYFDKARKVRTPGGKVMTQNYPEENPDICSNSTAPPQNPHSENEIVPEEPVRQEKVRQTREQMRSQEDGEFKQFVESPVHHGEPGNQRYGNRGGSSNEGNNKRGLRSYGGSEKNIVEKSPLHHQTRASTRTMGAPSPLWEGNKGAHDGSGGTGRLQPRTDSRGDESPDEGAAVPKFGDWDEKNPASADGYTHIFNKVREERNYPPRVGTPRAPSNSNTRKPLPPDSAKCCCFPWGRK